MCEVFFSSRGLGLAPGTLGLKVTGLHASDMTLISVSVVALIQSVEFISCGPTVVAGHGRKLLGLRMRK